MERFSTVQSIYMQQEDLGLGKQSVAFELDNAVRSLENIRTLSGTLPSLREINDTRTPFGHHIPGTIHTLMACRDLLELKYPEHKDITFEDLEHHDPNRFQVCRDVVLESRRIVSAVRMQQLAALKQMHR